VSSLHVSLALYSTCGKVKVLYLLRTNLARRLNFDARENLAVLSLRTFLLLHLTLGTKLLEDHVGVAALVRVGVVEAHCIVPRTVGDGRE
jgi:hypothetical protein